jgi:hypothetical protein
VRTQRPRLRRLPGVLFYGIRAFRLVYLGTAGRRAAAKLLSRDEARRITAKIAKLPSLFTLRRNCSNNLRPRRITAKIAKLPDLLGRRAPVEEQRRLYGHRPPSSPHAMIRGDDDAAGIRHSRVRPHSGWRAKPAPVRLSVR